MAGGTLCFLSDVVALVILGALVRQQFPIGMGTGAVYVTMSGLKQHSSVLTNVETFFFFLNLALFILNTTTLLLQFICESPPPSAFLCDLVVD